MKAHCLPPWLVASCLIWAGLVKAGICGEAAESQAAESQAALPATLAAGVRIEALGKPIDVEVGHAAPAYADINGDGLKDLLVGQFGEGKLRIYKNIGTPQEPRFGDFEFFMAGGQEAQVPFG